MPRPPVRKGLLGAAGKKKQAPAGDGRSVQTPLVHIFRNQCFVEAVPSCADTTSILWAPPIFLSSNPKLWDSHGECPRST